MATAEPDAPNAGDLVLSMPPASLGNTLPLEPNIMVLALWKPPFEDTHSQLLNALSAQTTLLVITDDSVAEHLLNGTSPPIVLVVDSAIAHYNGCRCRDAAILFVRNGGTLIFAGNFANDTSFRHMNRLFEYFSLPWIARTKYRPFSQVNLHTSQIHTSNLPRLYSQEAVFLAKVQPKDIIYSAARIEPFLHLPRPVNEGSLTSIALGSVGRGRVGYVGDVGAQEETTWVLMAMCGLKADW